MTAKTRRRLIVCLVAVVLTLPAETILLQALSIPQEAARAWVASLSNVQAETASTAIEAFPFAYRRAIMTRLPPEQRAGVWRNHITRYIDAHPDLDASIVAMLYNAAALATPSEFDQPSDAVRTEVGIIAEQIKVLLGKDEADYLFYRLGPRDGTFDSQMPIAEKLANYVRSIFVLQARTVDCDCSSSFGCGEASSCSTASSCNRDETWPMCGWFWNQVCDGLCAAGMGGD